MRKRSPKQFYKIVRRLNNNERVSLFVPLSSYHCVIYEPGKIAYADPVMRKRKYGLCIFEDMEHVREYLCSITRPALEPSIEVWRCTAWGVYKRLPRQLDWGYVDAGVFNPPAVRIPWPEGTRMAHAVRLDEIVGTYYNIVKGY
jgi:hypothetical protein